MVRPRSILCPLKVVLGADVHHRTRSAFIIEVLHKLGFSSSVKEFRNLERSMCSYELFETSLPTTTNNALYSSDNVDVQINTIDGHNTLHVMGMIRTSICNGIFSNKQIERRCTSLEELRKKHIPIFYTSKILTHEVNDILMDIKEFNLLPQINFVATYDTLRISAAIFKPVPQWAGFTRLLTRDNVHNGMYKIDFFAIY